MSIDLSDKQLMSTLYPQVASKSSPPEPDLEYICDKMYLNMLDMEENIFWGIYFNDETRSVKQSY